MNRDLCFNDAGRSDWKEENKLPFENSHKHATYLIKLNLVMLTLYLTLGGDLFLLGDLERLPGDLERDLRLGERDFLRDVLVSRLSAMKERGL